MDKLDTFGRMTGKKIIADNNDNDIWGKTGKIQRFNTEPGTVGRFVSEITKMN